jgi:hypothetical protein
MTSIPVIESFEVDVKFEYSTECGLPASSQTENDTIYRIILRVCDCILCLLDRNFPKLTINYVYYHT